MSKLAIFACFCPNHKHHEVMANSRISSSIPGVTVASDTRLSLTLMAIWQSINIVAGSCRLGNDDYLLPSTASIQPLDDFGGGSAKSEFAVKVDPR